MTYITYPKYPVVPACKSVGRRWLKLSHGHRLMLMVCQTLKVKVTQVPSMLVVRVRLICVGSVQIVGTVLQRV
jgi:hypothetical protein